MKLLNKYQSMKKSDFVENLNGKEVLVLNSIGDVVYLGDVVNLSVGDYSFKITVRLKDGNSKVVNLFSWSSDYSVLLKEDYEQIISSQVSRRFNSLVLAKTKYLGDNLPKDKRDRVDALFKEIDSIVGSAEDIDGKGSVSVSAKTYLDMCGFGDTNRAEIEQSAMRDYIRKINSALDY